MTISILIVKSKAITRPSAKTFVGMVNLNIPNGDLIHQHLPKLQRQSMNSRNKPIRYSVAICKHSVNF